MRISVSMLTGSLTEQFPLCHPRDSESGNPVPETGSPAFTGLAR
jgi:hypothetical protein